MVKEMDLAFASVNYLKLLCLQKETYALMSLEQLLEYMVTGQTHPDLVCHVPQVREKSPLKKPKHGHG